MVTEAKTLFEFDEYKEYLLFRENDWVGRGMRKELAEAMGCQAAYVSQVLNGKAHLSLEQCEKANPLLGHTKSEAHYFLVLLQLARAGTVGLKNYFNDQLSGARKERRMLSHRLGVEPGLSPDDQATYYGHPYFALVHMAVSIPDLQRVESLVNYLKIPRTSLDQILEFLTVTGLVERNGHNFTLGRARIHLPNTSKLIFQHHRNWRLKAMDNINFMTDEDLHYSSVVTLSKTDFLKIREQLVRAIEEAKKQVRESAEEEVAVFNVDLFTYKK